MFYSLDNVVSVPADTLFLQSFDSFHMKATNTSIRLIWLFLFLEVGYLQNGLSNCISKICINQLCTVAFVMFSVFLLFDD